MMITLNVIESQGRDMISGSYNGIQFAVSYDEQKFRAMQELKDKADAADTVAALQEIVEQFKPLTEESYKEIIETKTPYIVVNKHTNKFYLRYNNVVSKNALPQVFVDKILKLVEKNLPIDPLIKCWARYMRPVPGRPAYSQQQADLFARYISAVYTDQTKARKLVKEQGLAPEVAGAMATTTQVAITVEGLLVCYKVSDEVKEKFVVDEETEEVKKKSRYKKSVDPDTGIVSYDVPDYMEDRLFEPAVMHQGGDAFWCEGNGIKKLGHHIRVGCSHYLESWDQVGAPGNKGLHCGGLNYIRGFQREDTMTHNIFVDPMHIHTIAGLGEGTDGAMTVKQYFVHSSFGGVNRNIYHSSKYAALTDEEYAQIVKEAVDASAASVKEAEELLETTRALAGAPAKAASDVFTESK